MVGGLNENVEHSGHTFHVQTEATGSDGAKIVTLIYQGGTILLSAEKSFGHLVDEPDGSAKLAGLVNLQQKKAIAAIRSGAIDARLGLCEASEKGQEPSDEAERPSPAETAQIAATAQGMVFGVLDALPDVLAVGVLDLSTGELASFECADESASASLEALIREPLSYLRDNQSGEHAVVEMLLTTSSELMRYYAGITSLPDLVLCAVCESQSSIGMLISACRRATAPTPCREAISA